MQFFLIFLAFIFAVCVEILKPGLKKLQEKQTKMKVGNFRISSEMNFRYHSENCGAIFAIIAKFRYDSENL